MRTEERQRVAAIEAAFDPGDLWCDGADARWSIRAHHVLDHIEAMIRVGDAHVAVDLCQRATWCLVNAAPDIADTEAVMALADRLAAMHLRSCEIARPDPVELAEFVYHVASDGILGVRRGIVEPYLALLGDVGTNELRRRLADEERRLRRLSGLARSIEQFQLGPIRDALTR